MAASIRDDGASLTGRRRAIFAFDQSVDKLDEDATFLGLGDEKDAALYLKGAVSSLQRVRMVMHRIHESADDHTLKPHAQRRLRDLAVGLAEAGMKDVRSVRNWSERLSGGVSKSLSAQPWGELVKTQSVRTVAWGAKQWTGSPFLEALIKSPKQAAQSIKTAEDIAERGRLSPRKLAAVRRQVAARRARAARGRSSAEATERADSTLNPRPQAQLVGGVHPKSIAIGAGVAAGVGAAGFGIAQLLTIWF